jgi:hypothetical protein
LTEVGILRCKGFVQSIRIVSFVKTHVCKSLIGFSAGMALDDAGA